MADFALYYLEGSTTGKLLYDDLSEIQLSGSYNTFAAYNPENGVLYVCKNGTPHTLVGIRISDQNELYSYNIPSDKLKPLFVDFNDKIWCIEDPADKYIYVFNSDLASHTTYTLKTGNPLNDAIHQLTPVWYRSFEYFYLLYRGSPYSIIAKYHLGELDGGDPIWNENVVSLIDHIFVDLPGHIYLTKDGIGTYKYDKDFGTQLWYILDRSRVGFYSQETDKIYVSGYTDSQRFYEYGLDGNVEGSSENIGSGYRCPTDIYPDADGNYFYGLTRFVTVGGSNYVLFKYTAADWGVGVVPIDKKNSIIINKFLGGDPSGYLNNLIRGGEIMAEVSGRHLLAALKKGATWNTDIQIGANDGFLFLNENLGVLARESVPNESIGAADAFISCTDKLNTPADDKTIEFELIFEMFELMTALGLGTAGAPSAGTDGYTHTLRPAKDLADIFATFAKEPIDGSIIHCYPSIKVKGLEFAAAAGEMWKGTATVIASKFTNSPGVIVAGDFNNVTFRKTCGRIPFNACQIWMNAQSGGAVATGDAIRPSSLSFSFMRELDAYHCSTNDTDCDAYAVQEPVENGYPDIKLTMEFPIFSADTYITAVHADTHYKMKINFVGDLIGTDYYTWSVYFPNMELLNAEAAFDGAGKVVHPLEFRLKSVSSAPTGMSYGDPFYMEIINTISTDLLA